MKKRAGFAAVALSLTTVATATGFTAAPSVSSGPRDGLDRFRNQQLSWTDCADGELAKSGTECADVTVPLDYGKPAGRTLTVAISRIRSTDPDQRRGILQTNPGGPGGPGLGMPADLRKKMTPQVAAAYDIIGMDTRGLGRSTPLDCGLDRMSWMRSTGSDRAGFDESVRLAKDDARKCWEKYPDVLPHLSTRNIARDVDVIRRVLGERKTSWFGQSYGTILGATYAQMFPRRVDRIVLDSAADPAQYGLRMFQDMGAANERALDDLADWAAPRHERYGLGADPAAVRATVEGLIQRAERQPISIGGHRLDDHQLPFVLYFFGTNEIDNEVYAQTLRQLLDAADGKPVTVSEQLGGLLNAMFRPAETGTGPQYAATLGVLCADTVMPRDPETYWTAIQRARPEQPVFAPVHNAPVPCSFWKEKPRERLTKVSNDLPALQIQATGDTRTTYRQGLGMHRAMRGSVLVTVPERVHAVFVSSPNDCAGKAVNDYLLKGSLPARDTVCDD